jgi:quercetin dioxygenase-like cupin family protein
VTHRFQDDRGVIEDWFDGKPVDAVTRITTKKGAVRGNHFHKLTTQWTYVVRGRLRMVHAGHEFVAGTGAMVTHEPGISHAWKALEDTECLVFTRGPRSGEGYEDDTYRLAEPLLT